MKTRWLREVRAGAGNLMLHKLRSFLTMLGMIFGVSSVIAMLAVGEGASKEALSQIRKLGSNNLIIGAMKPTQESGLGSARVEMSMYGVTYDDYRRIRETLPRVTQAAPVKLLHQQAQVGERTMNVRVVGTTPAWFDLVRRKVIAGRVIGVDDTKQRKSVAVLTEAGARRLLAGREMLGEFVRIGGVIFEVIGIVGSEEVVGSSIESPDRHADIYIPLEVARDRFGDIQTQFSSGATIRERVELHQILVQVASHEDVEPTANAIEAMLARFHDKKDYQMHVPLALLRQAEATQRTFNIVLGSIASISLVVGGIGIMNIMLASVTERTREIGVRRAIGAKRQQIVRQFLIETIVLSTIGGALGMLVGFLVPRGITYFAGMPTDVTLGSLVLALGISMAAGIIFGLYPAVRAASLDPIRALRHE